MWVEKAESGADNETDDIIKILSKYSSMNNSDITIVPIQTSNLETMNYFFDSLFKKGNLEHALNSSIAASKRAKLGDNAEELYGSVEEIVNMNPERYEDRPMNGYNYLLIQPEKSSLEFKKILDPMHLSRFRIDLGSYVWISASGEDYIKILRIKGKNMELHFYYQGIPHNTRILQATLKTFPELDEDKGLLKITLLDPGHTGYLDTQFIIQGKEPKLYYINEQTGPYKTGDAPQLKLFKPVWGKAFLEKA